MGRKGGGQKGFFKQASRSREEEASDQIPEESASPAVAEIPEKNEKNEKNDSQGVEVDELEASRGEGGDDGAQPKFESKSQLKERHKKELQAHKKAMGQLGKKKKAEAARLTDELKARHAAELESFNKASTETGESGDFLSDDNQGDNADGGGVSLYGDNLGGSGDKKTKAQKRREKAAKKEAERDARIAKEQSEMGESSRELEERELNAKLEHLGLRIFDIKADGHCLYRAVNHQLSVIDQQGDDNGGGGKCNDDDSYAEMRQRAAAYLRGHADDFLPFFIGEDGNGDPVEEFDKHCNKVENTAEWGGEMELRALAHDLKKAIVVHSLELPDTVLGEEYLENGEPLRMCFMRHAYRLGDHYNSVEKI